MMSPLQKGGCLKKKQSYTEPVQGRISLNTHTNNNNNNVTKASVVRGLCRLPKKRDRLWLNRLQEANAVELTLIKQCKSKKIRHNARRGLLLRWQRDDEKYSPFHTSKDDVSNNNPTKKRLPPAASANDNVAINDGENISSDGAPPPPLNNADPNSNGGSHAPSTNDTATTNPSTDAPPPPNNSVAVAAGTSVADNDNENDNNAVSIQPTIVLPPPRPPPTPNTLPTTNMMNTRSRPSTPFTPADINNAINPPPTITTNNTNECTSCIDCNSNSPNNSNTYRSAFDNPTTFSPETNSIIQQLNQNPQMQQLLKKMATNKDDTNIQIFGALANPSISEASTSLPLPTTQNTSRNLQLSFESFANQATTAIATTTPLQNATYNNQRVDMSAMSSRQDLPPFTGQAFHNHRPTLNGQRGARRSAGKHGINKVARKAATHAKKLLLSALESVGDWEQQRETLFNLLLDPKVRDMYRSLSLSDGEETLVSEHVLKSIQKVMSKALAKRSSNSRRRTRKRQQLINCLCILVSSIPVSESFITKRLLAKHLGFSVSTGYRSLENGRKKAAQIMADDDKGFDLIEPDKPRSKYKPEVIKRTQEWLLNDCEVVIDNPCKNDEIFERDNNGNIMYDSNGNPLMIQKKLLLCSYRQLQLNMISQYPGMVLVGNKLMFSESTLRKIMPNHVKKATKRYKQMCGCQSCVIMNDMYACLLSWRVKMLLLLDLRIRNMDDGPEKVEKEVERDAYKAQVWKDGALVPLRAWEASSQLACDKVEVKEGDEEGRLFHRFQCVMGECGNCPKWHNIVPSIESECDRAIRYATYSGYHTCPIPMHKQYYIALNADNKKYCTKCYDLSVTEDQPSEKKPNAVRLKYISMLKSESMSKFMEEGGTYLKHLRHYLYHKTLIEMCGSTVAGKMANDYVIRNDGYILQRSDHTERYQPRQWGEIMSEGMGQEDSVSIEGRSVLLKAVGTPEFKKVLYAHCSDDKKQNAVTVLINILYVLDDLDKSKELPRDLLKRVFDIVDGCAVQYRCGTVLFSLALLAKRRNIRYTRIVQAPGHGKAEIDPVLGSEKTYADSVFDRPAVLPEDEVDVDIWAELRELSTREGDAALSRAMTSAAATTTAITHVPDYKMVDGEKLSLAKRVYDILSDPNRTFKNSTQKRKFKERRYHLRPVLSPRSHKLKMTAVGFPKGPRSGIGSHYCFMADPDLGLQIACRRFFCGCQGCENRLNKPTWQERYNGPWKECKFWEVFKIDEEHGWNDVSIISFEPARGCDEEEYTNVLAATLNDLGRQMSLSVVDGNYGAYGVDDKIKYYLVKWVGVPRMVEANVVVQNGEEDVQLFKGEWVCDGVWLNPVKGARHWYNVGETTVTVRMQSVLHTDLDMNPLSDNNPAPRGMKVPLKQYLASSSAIKLCADDHDELMDEAQRREDFDFEEKFTFDDDDASDYDSEVDEEAEAQELEDAVSDSEDDSSDDDSD